MHKLSLFLFVICLTLASGTVKSARGIDAQEIREKCFDTDLDRGKLLKLRTNKFEVKDPTQKQQLAVQLLTCLASADPVIRDGIAFSALQNWLRADSFTEIFYLHMFDTLTTALSEPVNDEIGVYQPFAALVLAEVVRVDRITPYLSSVQRQHVITVATNYLEKQRDYRGFDPLVGWRHGIAHSADLLLQLALNSALNKNQLDRILVALATQISAKDQHFYIYGEPKRLAMPLVYVYLRGQHSTEEWQVWLNKIISPAPLSSWQDAYQSQEGLAKLHNTKSFLENLFVLIKNSKNTALISMNPALERAIKSMP